MLLFCFDDNYGLILMAKYSFKVWKITLRPSSPDNDDEFTERESFKKEFNNRRGFIEILQ
jgi:hypothetical protein